MTQAAVQTPQYLARVEYYSEPDPDNPQAYRQFMARVPYLAQEATQWGTIIMDSITSAQNAYYRFDSLILNPGHAKDSRLIHGDMKREMVNQLMARFVWLPTNVVVIAHVSDKMDEFAEGKLRGVSAVGTLTGDLPTQYGETYRAKVIGKDEKGQAIRILQTRADGQWSASSQIQAPDPSWMDYEYLWRDANLPNAVRPPIHCLVYGESGTGKTTFACTFPKPHLWLMFDAPDKSTPILRMGPSQVYNDGGFYDAQGIQVRYVWPQAA